MAFYYIPQNAWGLVEQAFYEAVSFYSQQGGGCRPVVLWCAPAQRGAYTHFDGNLHAVNRALVDWLANGEDTNVIAIYTNDAGYAADIRGQILATGFYDDNGEAAPVIIPDANPDGFWGCRFTQDGPNWLDSGDQEEVRIPASWSDYWDGAPEWNGTGTFSTAIIDDLKGFIANYNGKFYFDFHEDED